MILYVLVDRVVLFNMLIVEEMWSLFKMKIIKFEEFLCMLMYLVVIVVGEFEYIEGYMLDGEVLD